MSYEIGLLMFLSMIVMLITGRHIYAVIGGVAVIFALALWGKGGAGLAFHAAISLLNWYPLLTLPIFIFMGYVFSKAGIAEDLYNMLHVWMGPIPGGLAIGTIVLMAIIAAMNGLSVAGMAIGTTLALPEMMKRNYDKLLVSGVIQAGSSLGILVPPSVVLVLYAMIARQPVGRLWLAGVFPGLILTALFIIYILIRAWLQPNLGPPLPKEERQMPLKQKLNLLKSGIPPIIIIFSMSGLFFMGVTSLVESSAVGALAVLIVALLKRRLTWKDFVQVLTDTLSVSCMFMWVILAALAFGAIFDGLGAIHAIKELFLERAGMGKWEIIIMMQLSFILLGTFLDDTAMLIIVAPLYVPIVVGLGFSPIWYGVLYTITCQIAYLTPPFGYNLFLMNAMAPKEIGLGDIYRSVWPFVGLMIVGLAIIMLFPSLATWLPEQVYAR